MIRKILLVLPLWLLAALPIVADQPDEERRDRIEQVAKQRLAAAEAERREREGVEKAERMERLGMLKCRYVEMQKSGADEAALAELKRDMMKLAEGLNKNSVAEQREREERQREARERQEREQREGRGDEAEHREHPEQAEFGQRMEHLHIAADHLRGAGMHDLAAEVMHRAEAVEREHHQRERGHQPPPPMMVEVQEQMQLLRREIEELHQHVRNLERVIRSHHKEGGEEDDDDDDDDE